MAKNLLSEMKDEYHLDEPLEMIRKFQDQILTPLRVAGFKDLNSRKMKECIDWAKLVDKLTARLSPDDMNQTERLFLALIDNPRLPAHTISNYIALIFEAEKQANNAKICLEEREEVRKFLLMNFSEAKKNRVLKEFIR